MKAVILIACLLAFLFTCQTPIFAVDFTVNASTDLPDTNIGDGVCLTSAGNCSLRAAVQEANSLASNDRAVLPANLTVTLTTANGGEIAILNNGTLEIIGAGANSSTINGGTGTNRIFYTSSANVFISGVTLTGGDVIGASPNGDGGAIYVNNGALTLERVRVTGNSASSGGGGVDFNEGTHRIINSTFSGNSASFGGGFINDGGTVTIVNSTVSGNTADNGGGGFVTDNNFNSNTFGTVTLRNSTVTNNNTGTGGGGIVKYGGALNFGNTIVAGNSAADNSYPEFELGGGGGGTIISAGGNLVGDSAGDSTNTGFGVIAYLSTDKQNINPQLGALASSGGPTPTHAVLAGSPLIDAGVNILAVDPSNGNAALTTDQRGGSFTRIVDGDSNAVAVVDIGAFELQLGTTAAGVSVGGRVTTAKGRGIGKVFVLMTDSSGVTRSALSNTLGFYNFADVAPGETYIFSVSSKRYSFNQIRQVYTIVEQIDDMNFVADY